MFPQLKEKFCYVGGKGFWTIPIEDGDGGTSVGDRIPKVNLGGREVEDRRDAKGNETEGLEMRECERASCYALTNRPREHTRSLDVLAGS